MRKKYVALMLLGFVGIILILISSTSHAANTVNYEGKVIQITIVDADWAWSDAMPSTPVEIISIDYIPAATDEICVIKEGSDSGPIIFYVKSADTCDQRTKPFYGALLRPYFDYSDSTNSADGKIIIILK